MGRVMEVKGKPQADGEWSTGFCGCCSDCSSCCLTCWCPCITVGRIAEIVDQGSSSCCATGALYMLSMYTVFGSACISCKYRTKMRKQYNLKGSECGDYLKHFFCELCALTQTYRELTKRGFDVPLGCITCWCPCITFGQVAEIVDQGSTTCGTAGALYALINAVTGCACIYSCFYRGKMRAQYNIEGSDCGDCLKHFFCELCALTQQYRELKNRGFNMDLGCITCWCPCITFGQVAEIVDQGSTTCGTAGALYTLISCFTGCGCIYSCFYRGKMRAQYNIGGNDCGDCLKHFFCELCALTQQYRELKNRGFNMDLGWAGNIQRQQNQGVAMGAPVFQGGMTR
ncbi:unnamed protein product [Brassica rapa]|uniref:Uncharacterized protein n=2 Tax=Brassica TaxID=3705 RepID=A0A8D9D124_BRACM|nr:unnamed protein product [Brassica napus]CAG7866974.1 unnamed protein product [Brassica rapa]